MLRIRQWLRLIPGYPADYADLGRCESGQQQEQQSVRRNVQVEVHHTVRQDSAAGNQRAHLQRRQKPARSAANVPDPPNHQHREEPGTAGAARQTRFRQSFEIIIVSVVHHFAVVERLVFCRAIEMRLSSPTSSVR